VIEAQLVLHSDNGSPMKGITMIVMLEKLGVFPSFSRPSVSDDNPYSESLFKTLKYHPSFPRLNKFATLLDARNWCEKFTLWYNTVHLHSALKFVTPQQRHTGEDAALRQQRHAVYLEAQKLHPERWARDTRNWTVERVCFKFCVNSHLLTLHNGVIKFYHKTIHRGFPIVDRHSPLTRNTLNG